MSKSFNMELRYKVLVAKLDMAALYVTDPHSANSSTRENQIICNTPTHNCLGAALAQQHFTLFKR